MDKRKRAADLAVGDRVRFMRVDTYRFGTIIQNVETRRVKLDARGGVIQPDDMAHPTLPWARSIGWKGDDDRHYGDLAHPDALVILAN